MTHLSQHRGWVPGIRLRAASIALALAVVSVVVGVATPSAQAQTFNVLYAFKGPPDGAGPTGDLLRNAAGTLFGTTVGGGRRCLLRKNYYSLCGTVFQLNKVVKETVLYRFTGESSNPPDGAWPGLSNADLVRDAAGNLYGTTIYGGDPSCHYGCGTVFKVDKLGNETVLHSFTGHPDGESPQQVWFAMLPAICTEQPPQAVIFALFALTAVACCSRWIRPARRPCCTASPEDRTDGFPLAV